MGILDSVLNNMTPDQQQGLLAAAAQMMQQSGPSLRPTSLGQILGGGMTAFNDSTNAARKRKLEEDAAKQSGLLRGLQIQEAQGGLADHERKRQQEDLLRKFYMGERTGTAPDMQPPSAPPMPTAMPNGQGQPAPMPANAPQAQSGSPDIFAQRMGLAQRLRAAGHHAEADAQEAAALKFRDEYSMDPKVMMGPNGKMGNFQLSKFGSAPRDTGLGVRPDMVEVDLRDRKQFMDKNMLTPGQSFKIGIDPGTIYSGEITKRGQNMTDNRARELNVITAANKPLTESQGKATNFASRMTDAEAITTRLEKAGVNGSDFATMAAGSPLTNWAASEEGQMYRQAQENWVTANLRQESGAAIPKDEMNKDIRKYFPVVGDKPGAIAQKARARQTATKGMLVQAGPGAKQVPGIVSGEPAAAPEAKPAAAPKETTFDVLPPASQFDGKRMASDNGTIYKSVGGKWVKE